MRPYGAEALPDSHAGYDAMIVLGGSSMHKGGNGWQASRAVACLPALTRALGIAHRGRVDDDATQATLEALLAMRERDGIAVEMEVAVEAAADAHVRDTLAAAEPEARRGRRVHAAMVTSGTTGRRSRRRRRAALRLLRRRRDP